VLRAGRLALHLRVRLYVGVEAVDQCHDTGPLAVLPFHTTVETQQVDACFIATAAYGSPLAASVTALRGFRDRVLRRSVLGELVTESYYTFGPPVAQLIGGSELMRAAARDALAPVVDRVARATRQP
jgi:hypothetical protein